MNQYNYSPGRFQLLPTVIKNILIINGILFLAKFVFEFKFGISLDQYLGLHYFSATDFMPFQFITYLFMHGDLRHIFFNMFAVWMFGSALENYWGAKKFLIFYFLTGFGAALAQYGVIFIETSSFLNSIDSVLQNMNVETFENLVGSDAFRSKLNSWELTDNYNSFVPTYNSKLANSPGEAMLLASDFLSSFKESYLNSHIIIGASGSLFGLLAAYGMLFPNTLIYIYFFIPIKAKYFVILYGLIELISGLSNNENDNVAHFAHLGGMVIGIIIILFWRRKNNFHHSH